MPTSHQGRLRITSDDGTAHGTLLELDGKPLYCATKVALVCNSPRDMWKATVECVCPTLDILADAEVIVHETEATEYRMILQELVTMYELFMDTGMDIRAFQRRFCDLARAARALLVRYPRDDEKRNEDDKG